MPVVEVAITDEAFAELAEKAGNQGLSAAEYLRRVAVEAGARDAAWVDMAENHAREAIAAMRRGVGE